MRRGQRRAAAPRAGSTPPAGLPPLLWLALLYLAVMVANSALSYLDALVMARTGQAAMRDLRRAVFAHIQQLHLGFFDRYPVGRLVTRATNDVENVSEMFSAGIVALVTDVLKMLGFAVALFLVDARLAVLTFLVVPVLAVAAIVFRLKVRDAFRAVRVRIARINAYLQENVTGMKVVQLFNREAQSFRDFDAMNADHRDAWFMSIRYDAALFAVVELASGITVAIIIWQATGLADVGQALRVHRLDAALLPAAARPVGEVLGDAVLDGERGAHLPAARHAAAWSPIGSSRRSCRCARPARRRGLVEFDHVWFAYQGEDWVLATSRSGSSRARGSRSWAPPAPARPRSSSCSRASTIRRAAASCSTASTCAICPQSDLRRRVAMVLQDVFLFSGTIAENIALDRPDVGPRGHRARRARGARRPLHRARCRRATRRPCASAAATSRRASASCSPSPARSPTAATCWCSTRPPARSTARPRR